MVMDEDEILGTITIVLVISCGLANIFCVFYNVGNRQEEYVQLRDIV